MTFESLGLSENTLKALLDLGFSEPTPIQAQSIPSLLESDRDLLGLAQTGTGKTAAFALPIIEKINHNSKHPQALILCPTRELCLQITSDIEKFTKYHSNLHTVAIYGGASISTQIRELRRGVQIIVATPGRMIDVIDRGEVHFDDTKIVVLDEADEMLNMGFQESIDQILSKTPEQKSTWLFTATMPKEIKKISKKYMEDPVEVSVSVNKGNDNIEHEYYVVNARNKYSALKRLVDFNPDIFGIVFCKTKNETKDIADLLIRDGYNSDALHGDLTQQQRDIVMNRYRDRSLQLLVATDVAARGIDVSDVTHVIHYSLPDDVENYTHRSGRTARAGKKGVSISIITKKDIGKISQLERIVSKQFIKSTIPNGFDVCEKQLFSIINKAKNVEINEEMMSPYLEKINAEFEDMTKEEIIKRFAAIEFNRFLDYYKDAEDLNDTGARTSREGTVGAPVAQKGYTRFFINLGSLDNLRRGDLLKIICENTNIKGATVGRIDMKGMYSFFEVEERFQKDVMDGMRGLDLQGRKIRVDIAGELKEGGGNRDSFGGERRERSGFGERRSSGYNDRRSGGNDRRDSGERGGFRRDRDDRSSRSGGSFERKPFERREGDRNRDAFPKRDFSDRKDAGPKRESSFGSKETNSEDKPKKKRENKFPYDLGDF